jgi:hypothetical protein
MIICKHLICILLYYMYLYLPVIRPETLLHIIIIILYYTCAQLNKPTELIKLYNSIIMIAYVYKEKKIDSIVTDGATVT